MRFVIFFLVAWLDYIMLDTTTVDFQEEDEQDRTKTLPPITENPFEVNVNETDVAEIEESIRDVGYYLRAHKFNEYDRRYYTAETLAPREYHAAFPRPPLRSLHWEVRRFCEPSFIGCVKYLGKKVKAAGLTREEDSVYIVLHQNWNFTNHSDQIAIVDEECRKTLETDDIRAKPFQGPLERLQWRTTASYYMCWYTMNEVPLLKHFNQSCDNFASCLDPQLGVHNNDSRAEDAKPFYCALYSFCPDPCCSLRHTLNMDSCWDSEDNPCFEDNPRGQRDCSLIRQQNTNFNDIVLNRWNVTCRCPQEGMEWNSRFGMCIDVDECFSGSHKCHSQRENCINVVGSYQCVCKWGFSWDNVSGVCKENDVFAGITYRRQDGEAEVLRERETSLVQRIFKMFRRKGGERNSSPSKSVLFLCFLSNVVARSKGTVLLRIGSWA